jgi:hypothetical protein
MAVATKQCYGTGTAGTVNFCLGGTGNRTHYGYGTGFGSGSNIKWNKKVKRIKNERTTFRETMLILPLKRQGFIQIFVVGKRC